LQFSVERSFSVHHPTAEGHFPGNPIIPGALLLDEVVWAIRGTSEQPADSCEIRSVKFLAPVRPGDRVMIRWSATPGGETKFECFLIESERLAVAGSLKFHVATA